jgi:hypothetical protein
MNAHDISKLKAERCECLRSIRGGYTCLRCKLIQAYEVAKVRRAEEFLRDAKAKP